MPARACSNLFASLGRALREECAAQTARVAANVDTARHLLQTLSMWPQSTFCTAWLTAGHCLDDTMFSIRQNKRDKEAD